MTQRKCKVSRIEKHGNATIEYHDDQTIIVEAKLFLLSIAASRKQGDETMVDHIASVAPSSVTSIDEAHNYGMTEAEDYWPSSDGWVYHIDVRLHPFKFRFRNEA